MNLHPPMLAALCVWALGPAALAQLPEPVPAPLADRLPRLLEQSSWGQDIRDRADRSERGAFPVGNGHVFACSGLGERANTLSGIVGPHYGAGDVEGPDGAFAPVTLDLVRGDGTVVDLPAQRVRRVLDAGFVVTEDRAPDGISLRTTTFAPPNARAIWRVVAIESHGAAAASDLRLRARWRDATAAGRSLAAARGTAFARLSISGAQPRDGALEVPIGRLEAGRAWSAALRIDLAEGDAPDDPVELSVEAAARLAARTLDHWRRALAGTTAYDTDHRRLRDLIRDWKVTVRILRCARSGVATPMLGRRVASVRDQNGALLALLRFRMWDEARRTLEYFYDATRLLGRVPETVALGLDFEGLGDREPDWDAIEVPGSEIPSWIVLQHLWYWRATRDTALIKKHEKYLLACVKRQRREAGNLMRFLGTEPYLGGGLFELADRFGPHPQLFGDDPAIGRHAFSLGSAALLLTSVGAIGQLLEAIDRDERPDAYADPERAVANPGDAWTNRVYALMTEIESHFWLEDEGFFAPAISPVDRHPHRAPLANVDLLPLWCGWTFPTGEKSRDNLRNTLQRLWRQGARIGTTPSLGYTTGDLQGMLLVALAERDGARRADVIDALLAQAAPAGEWARFYGPDGRAVGIRGGAPERLRPGESGVNLDAILFAITGIRHASVPSFDDDDIRLELRLPRGARYVTVRDTAKDGRRLNVFFRETTSRLTEQERRDNDRLDPELRLDPNVPHRRMRFVVELIEGRPREGYYNVSINAAGTLFPRYLKPGAPATAGENDLRRVEDMAFSLDDESVFLPDGPQRLAATAPRRIDETPGARVIAISCRSRIRELLDPDRTTLFDSGMPFRISDLEPLLLGADGRLAHELLLLDWSHDRGRPASFGAAASFASDAWRELRARYEASGGRVLETPFAVRGQLSEAGGSRAIEASTDGAFRLGAPAERTLRIALRSAERREVVLSLGTGCGVAVSLNGAALFTRSGPRDPVPDLDSQLVTLEPGPNRLELALRADGEPTVFVRCTAVDGLPVDIR